MPLNRARVRVGFTLIEIMAVVILIAFLTSLAAFAAHKALITARQRFIIYEINQMSAAMENYREQYLNYPPNLGEVATSSTTLPAGTLIRNSAFIYHLRKSYDGGAMDGVNLNKWSGAGSLNIYYRLYNTYYTYNAPSNYAGSDGPTPTLDFASMDQAEALVFWLGGFPCPYVNGSYVAPRKLIGFYKDRRNPWGLDYNSTSTVSASQNAELVMRNRVPPLFDFDESRLVDYDQDGWLEYVPERPSADEYPASAYAANNPPPAPYVYFCAANYSLWNTLSYSAPMSTYPPYPGNAPATGTVSPVTGISSFMPIWGMAAPYAKSIDSNGNNVQWMNPNSFQIISAGLDRMYGTQPQLQSDGSIGSSYAYTTMAIYQPTGMVTLPPAIARNLQPEEDDNLSNFADRTFRDDVGN